MGSNPYRAEGTSLSEAVAVKQDPALSVCKWLSRHSIQQSHLAITGRLSRVVFAND